MKESVSAPRERRALNRERRNNSTWAQVVERGIELKRLAGDGPALAFLTVNGVSEHVVLRVLACAAFRRKDWIRHDSRTSGDSAIMEAITVAEYRGFAVTILCEPQDDQLPAAFAGVALLSCCASNGGIDKAQRLHMRHALTSGRSFMSFDQACAALVAQAREYIDLFHEQQGSKAAFQLPRAAPVERRKIPRPPT